MGRKNCPFFNNYHEVYIEKQVVYICCLVENF